MNLSEIGLKVLSRRAELGLTQERLGKLCGLSRSTINQLEKGSLSDLGIVKLNALLDVLNLHMNMQTPHIKSHALEMASITASVSYKTKLLSADLATALASGMVAHQIAPHIATLLDEAPIALLVNAVQEAAKLKHVTTKKIWLNIDRLALEWQLPRPALR